MEDTIRNMELSQLREAIGAHLQWGRIAHWSTRDFENLSEDIFLKTGVSLSVTTLKRILGRVRYDAAPAPATLDTMAKYLGYAGWRDYRRNVVGQPVGDNVGHRPVVAQRRLRGLYLFLVVAALMIVGGTAIWLVTAFSSRYIDPASVTFSIRRVARGVPNTVVFNYDVSNIEAGKIELQQDWNPEHRFRLAKDGKEYTLFYPFPGYYRAKLVADGQILREEDLFIPSDGWTAAVDAEPSPRYILQEELIRDTSLRVSDQVAAEIAAAAEPNWLNFYYVADQPQLDGRNFTLQARFRHVLRTGSNICQHTRILLYGTKDVLRFPLSIPGCTAQLNIYLAGTFVRGEENDLSGFGCDLSDWVDLKVTNRDNHLTVWVNHREVLQHALAADIGKLGGVRLGFEGLGEIKAVQLNGTQLLP